MFSADVSPSSVCDEWQPVESDHVVAAAAAKPVSARTLTRHLNMGRRKAERLEPKLAAVLKRIFDQQADDVADAFARKATDHLTANAGVTGRPHEYVAPPGVTGSMKAMIALYPTAEQADALAEDGTDPATLHCTLAFLGDITADQAQTVASALQQVAAEHGPLSGIVGGIASFDDNGDGHPSIVLPDVPGLVELRQAAVDASDAAGVPVARNHGFTAHITIAYRKDGPQPPSQDALGQPLTFRDLHVVQGDRQVAAHPLTGPGAVTAAGDQPQQQPDWSPPAPDEIINIEALAATLRTKTDPVRLAVIQDSMEPALAEAGIAFDVTNPLTARVFAQSGSQVTNIAQTTRLNVMRSISASYNQGLSIPDTAQLIRSGMKEASEARATLIARTELVGAVSGGSLAATQIVAQETGVQYSKTWLTSTGAKFPRHEEYDGLNGQTVALDANFDVGGESLEFPGDPSGSPENVCNCRCTLVYDDAAEQQAEALGIDTGGE